MTDYIVVFVSTKDEDEAKVISKELLDRKLVACCNIVDQINSSFYWKQQICSESESLLMLKARRDLFGGIEKVVKKLHSYEVPEIIALPIVVGNEDYLNWINESTE